MPKYNTMQDEQIIEEGGGSILLAFLLHPILSILTLFIYPVLAARNSGVAVTDQRIIIKDGGLLSSKTNEVRLDNVQGVQNIPIKLLFVIPVGNTLTVSNAAGESFTINTENPGDVRNAINRAQT